MCMTWMETGAYPAVDIAFQYSCVSLSFYWMKENEHI